MSNIPLSISGRKLKITDANLNVNTFENLLCNANLFILSSTDHKYIDLDISEIKFIDPYSIINLCILMQYLKKYYPYISLLFPNDINVRNYLHRIGFFNNIPSEIKFKNPLSHKKFNDTDVLLEITPIQKQKDIEKAINYSITKINRILETSLGYTDKDIVSFCTALSETCQNIVDHSEDQGFVSVQKYHKDSNYVIMAVSDLGIGIKKSLAKRYNVTCWNHAKAIQNALQLGTGRLPDRGKGLYIVNEIVKKYSGRLIIRSCSGCIETGKNLHSYTVPYFPGTQIYIKL